MVNRKDYPSYQKDEREVCILDNLHPMAIEETLDNIYATCQTLIYRRKER